VVDQLEHLVVRSGGGTGVLLPPPLGRVRA
jgi:hypothetical protein